MSNNLFYKELYRQLTSVDEFGKWGWINLDADGYKDLSHELSGERRNEIDKSYSSGKKNLYPLRLKVRLKRFLYSYAKAARSTLALTASEIEKKLQRLGEVCDSIIDAYHYASIGDRGAAVDCLYKEFFEKDIFLSNFYSVVNDDNNRIKKARKKIELREDERSQDVCLYRMRANDKYFIYNNSEISHIPFDLAHLTSNERYSICGLPCLYLASSSYNCWLELSTPQIETANIALFKPDLDVKFLDLCFPNFDDDYDEKRIKLLPLVEVCDMSVKYPDANYKYEYTIPQLVLECLVKYRDINSIEDVIGIRYSSVKRKTIDLAFSYNKYKRLYYNYVFPPVKVTEEGQCEVIERRFQFCGTTSSFNMQNIDRQIPLVKEYYDNYEDSLFYKLENHLKRKGMLVYNSLEGVSAFPLERVEHFSRSFDNNGNK